MIFSLHGTLIFTDIRSFVVECGGVGYKCTATLNTLSSLPKKGSEVFVYTYMNVKEDAVDLYGFIETTEMECFKLITSVNGVGPRIGIAILSDFTPDQVALYIASGDSKSLTRASGVGAKLAQRIVLELKDKVAATDISFKQDLKAVGNVVNHSNAQEALSAMMALGYSQSEASLAVSRTDQSLSVQQIIKESLKSLSK